MDNQPAEFTIKDVGPILARRRWMIILCLAVCLLVGWVITARSAKIFASTSKLLFNRPSYAVLLSDTSPTAPTMEDKPTQVYLLKSSAVADLASKKLVEQDIEKSGSQIAAALKVTDVENTDIIELTAEDVDPAQCAAVANAVATAFVEYKRNVRQENVNLGIDVLRGQISTAERNLMRAGERLAAYKTQNSIFKPDKQVENRLTQITALNQDIALTNASLTEAKERESVLAEQLDHATQALSQHNIRNNAQISELQSRINAKQADILAAEMKYTENYPGILQDMRAELKQLQSQLSDQLSKIATNSSADPEKQGQLTDRYMEVVTTASGLDAKLRLQQELLEKATNDLLAIPAKERRLADFERSKMVAESIYTSLLSNLEKAQVDKTRQTDTVILAESAKPANPNKPVRPNPVRNLGLSLLLGLVIGIFGAFLLEYMDDMLRTVEDVKRYLDLPVLGQIPALPGGGALVIDLHSKSPIAEAYRTLRSNIFFVSIDHPIRSMVITSASISEGKSTTSANLALTMAQEGKRILLVDADLRHPTQHELFGIDGTVGLTDVLTSRVSLKDAVQNIPETHLDVLPCGGLPSNPSEILASARMSEVMEEMLKIWDLVVFDTPPCVVVADAVILASRVDAVLQVVDAESGARQSAIDAREALKTARARHLGVALNRAQGRSGRYYNYYHYESSSRQQLPRPSFLKPRGGNGAGTK